MVHIVLDLLVLLVLSRGGLPRLGSCLVLENLEPNLRRLMLSLHPELTGWFLDPTEAGKPAGLAPTWVLFMLLLASGVWGGQTGASW